METNEVKQWNLKEAIFEYDKRSNSKDPELVTAVLEDGKKFYLLVWYKTSLSDYFECDTSYVLTDVSGDHLFILEKHEAPILPANEMDGLEFETVLILKKLY